MTVLTPGVRRYRKPGTNQWRAQGRPTVGLEVRRTDYGETGSTPGTTRYEATLENTGAVLDPALPVRYVSAAGVLSEDPADDDFGRYVISTPNTTLENLDIRGGIKITAANVTVRNCIIRGWDVAQGYEPDGTFAWRATVDVRGTGAAGYHILDCDILNEHSDELHLGVYGEAGGTVERCRIVGGVDGMRIWGGANNVLGCYFGLRNDYPASSWTPSNGPHADDIQFGVTQNYTGPQVIQGCTFHGSDVQPIESTNDGPSAVMIPQGVMDLTIDNNRFEGVTCWPINAGGGAVPNAGASMTISNNRIKDGWKVTSGSTGHIIASSGWRAIWDEHDNEDLATGGAIRVKNG